MAGKKQNKKIVPKVKVQPHTFTVSDNAYLTKNKSVLTSQALARDVGATVEETEVQLKALENEQAAAKPTGLPCDRFEREKPGVVCMTGAQSQSDDERRNLLKTIGNAQLRKNRNCIAKINPDLKSELDND